MPAKNLEMDQKGRIHIPKELRDKLGLKPGRPISGKVEDQTLLIEPQSDIFDRLASLTKCNFESVAKSLPRLRKTAERQLEREIDK